MRTYYKASRHIPRETSDRRLWIAWHEGRRPYLIRERMQLLESELFPNPHW